MLRRRASVHAVTSGIHSLAYFFHFVLDVFDAVKVVFELVDFLEKASHSPDSRLDLIRSLTMTATAGVD